MGRHASYFDPEEHEDYRSLLQTDLKASRGRRSRRRERLLSQASAITQRGKQLLRELKQEDKSDGERQR